MSWGEKLKLKPNLKIDQNKNKNSLAVLINSLDSIYFFKDKPTSSSCFWSTSLGAFMSKSIPLLLKGKA